MESIYAIDWKQFGVFTDDQVVTELILVFTLATIGFTAFYYINKMFFPAIVRAVAGP